MFSELDTRFAEQLVRGQYRVLAKIGQGGMGDVYLANYEVTPGRNRLVVIKRLRNLDDEQHVAMFLDEARIVRQLDHPNIVRTFEIGEESGAHLIVMEYLSGPTLGRLRRMAAPQGGVPWFLEVEIARNLLEGLHYAHELRGPDGRALHLVHRDLSPENVIVTDAGECKILDFGIAKAADNLVQTQAGSLKGKLKFMPPEQARGELVDRRADVFAAGVVLWEGLSRQTLWGDRSSSAILTALARNEIPSLADCGPGVPKELRQICETALAADRLGRFESAAAMKAALEAYVETAGIEVSRAQLAAFVQPRFAEDREKIENIVSGQADNQTLKLGNVGGANTPRTPSGQGLQTPGGRVPAGTRMPPGLRPLAPLAAPAPFAEELSEVETSERGLGEHDAETPVGNPQAVNAPLGPFARATLPLPAQVPATPLAMAASAPPSSALNAQQAALPSAALPPAPVSAIRSPAVKWVGLAGFAAMVAIAGWFVIGSAVTQEAPPVAASSSPPAAPSGPASVAESPVAEKPPAVRPNLASRSDGKPRASRTARPKAAPGARAGGDGKRGSLAATSPRPSAEAVSETSRAAPAPSPVASVQPAPPPAPAPAPAVAPAAAKTVPASEPLPGGPIYSTPPAAKFPMAALPATYAPTDAAQLQRMCTRIETAAVSLARVSPEYARGITEPLRRQLGKGEQIYPAAMYVFIVREAGFKHDKATAAARLVTALRDGQILRLKDALEANR